MPNTKLEIILIDSSFSVYVSAVSSFSHRPHQVSDKVLQVVVPNDTGCPGTTRCGLQRTQGPCKGNRLLNCLDISPVSLKHPGLREGYYKINKYKVTIKIQIMTQ